MKMATFSYLLPKLYGLHQIVIQTRSDESIPLVIEVDSEFHNITSKATESFIMPAEWVPMANTYLENAQVKTGLSGI